MMLLGLAVGTLADIIYGQVPATRAHKVYLGDKIAAGLAALHVRNILHLDIKPANILISENGAPMVADFGECRMTMIVVTKHQQM